MRKSLIAAAIAATAIAAPASAAVSIVVEGGGTPVVFEDTDGSRFGLVGADARRQDNDNVVNQPSVDVDLAYINSLISSGPNAVAAYSCSGGASNLSCNVLTSLTVEDEARLFDSILLQFASGFTGNVVFANPGGRTSTLSLANVTQQGAPPIAGAVPEPSTWLTLLLGFFAVGGVLRNSKRKEGKLAYAA